MWRRSTPTTRTCRCRPRSRPACWTCRMPRPPPSKELSWKPRHSPVPRCRSAATWRGWTPGTIAIVPSAPGASPLTWPVIISTTRRNGPGGCGSIGRGRSVAGTRLSLRADSTWKTAVFFTPFNDRIQRQSPLGLLDLSAEFGPAHRHWSVLAYGRNLTNEPYITGSNSAPLPAIGGRPADPRQVGLQFAIRR